MYILAFLAAACKQKPQLELGQVGGYWLGVLGSVVGGASIGVCASGCAGSVSIIVDVSLGAQHCQRFANLLFFGAIEELVEDKLKHLNARFDVGSAMLAGNRKDKTFGLGAAVLVVGDIKIRQTINYVSVAIAAADHFVQYGEIDIPSRRVRVGGGSIVLATEANQPNRILDVELLDDKRVAPASQPVANNHGSYNSLNSEVQAFLCHDKTPLFRSRNSYLYYYSILGRKSQYGGRVKAFLAVRAW